MWEFFKKSTLLNIILFALFLFVCYRTYGVVRQAVVVRREAAGVERKVAELTGKKRQLEVRLEELSTNEGVERHAKERLNLKNPGEEVVVVVSPGKEATKISFEVASPLGFWGRVKDFFTRLFSR